MLEFNPQRNAIEYNVADVWANEFGAFRADFIGGRKFMNLRPPIKSARNAPNSFAHTSATLYSIALRCGLNSSIERYMY